MSVMQSVVQMIQAQSFAFALSWVLAFALGHRVRFGHWTLSLLFAAAVQAAAWAYVAAWHGPPPHAIWWIGVTVVALVTIALSEHWNAIGQSCMSSTLALSGLFLAYLLGVNAQAHLGVVSLVFAGLLLVLQTAALARLPPGGQVRGVQPLTPKQRAQLPRLRAAVRLAQHPQLLRSREPPPPRLRRHLGLVRQRQPLRHRGHLRIPTRPLH